MTLRLRGGSRGGNEAALKQEKLNQHNDMGTRSLTHIYMKADSEKPFATIYRQFDGYPSAMGEDIKTILGDRELVNGYSNPDKQCNGMGCAAAMLVGNLKDGKCGNVYLYAPGVSDCGEEYTYRIYPNGSGFRFVIDGIYDGPMADFDSSTLNEAEE